jgi:fluoride exporter
MSPQEPTARSTQQANVQPIDADADPRDPGRPRERRGHPWVLPVISLGGMLGASARYALELGWPRAPGGVPWATLGINVSGCLLIGVLMVYVVEVGGAHSLLRPFLGVGVLGGFTTFSTYTVETHTLLTEGRATLALGYLVGTLVAAMATVTVGVVAARGTLRARRWSTRRRGGTR